MPSMEKSGMPPFYWGAQQWLTHPSEASQGLIRMHYDANAGQGEILNDPDPIL